MPLKQGFQGVVQGERGVELMSKDILDSACADADAVTSECTYRDTGERERRAQQTGQLSATER